MLDDQTVENYISRMSCCTHLFSKIFVAYCLNGRTLRQLWTNIVYKFIHVISIWFYVFNAFYSKKFVFIVSCHDFPTHKPCKQHISVVYHSLTSRLCQYSQIFTATVQLTSVYCNRTSLYQKQNVA